MRSIIVLLIISLFYQAQAQEVFEFYNGIRSLSMGGTTVATVNDETALVLNPAALGRLRNHFITVVDPEIELGANVEGLFGLDIASSIDTQSGLDKIEANPTKRIYSRSQLFPSIVLPNFGFGVLAKYRLASHIDPTSSNYIADYQSDWAAIVGYNFRFLDGRIKLGFNAKAINRQEIKIDQAAKPTGVTVQSTGSEGLGIGFDIGLIMTGPWKALPTFALVARDYGGTAYGTDGFFATTTSRPTTTEQTLDMGFAIHPIMGKKTRTTFSLEARDILNASSHADKQKYYHFGLEFNYFDAIFLRAGYNQRYWTAGLEFALNNYQLQLASYGEEVGTAAATLEDRRYVFKFAYRF